MISFNQLLAHFLIRDDAFETRVAFDIVETMAVGVSAATKLEAKPELEITVIFLLHHFRHNMSDVEFHPDSMHQYY